MTTTKDRSKAYLRGRRRARGGLVVVKDNKDPFRYALCLKTTESLLIEKWDWL
jgi:hypothetical protein